MNRSSSPSTPCFLSDAGNAPDGGCATVLQDPVGIVRADRGEEVPTAIERLEQALHTGLTAAGFFSYELGDQLEPRLLSQLPTDRRVPLLWFALFPAGSRMGGERLTAFFDDRLRESGPAKLTDVRPLLDKSAYLRRFERVKQLISDGDIYQANLSFRLGLSYEGDPFSLYARLRRRQPVAYGAFLDTGAFSVLSFSPELFFEVEKGQILTRPMKGTIRRGQTPQEDRALYEKLQGDPKNRAENLMIVDLMRNDFSRLCEAGSVKVDDLYRIEAFPTLYQMTSGVRGRLRQDAGLAEIMKALLPAGSITGAPKIRAQEVIRELEDGPRGLYCGAMGVMSRDRHTGELSARFNVAIRTLTLFPDGSGEAGIGSGIVDDSVGEEEYAECLLKAEFLTRPDFRLIETMRLDEDRGYYLLQRHLDRLLRSSRALNFLCPLDDIRRALQEQARALDEGCYRVRLVLDTGGRFDLTATRIEKPDPAQIIGYAISGKRVSSADSLLAHKTTRRELFDEEWTRAHERFGAQEILFLNERDELTEGARSNLFVELEDGRLATPPLSCGLLPGTLREELMNEGRLVEQVLKWQDLEGVRIFFGNSVRGLQPARFVGEDGGE